VVWEKASALIRRSLLTGHAVVIPAAFIVEPYVKSASRVYHPGTGRIQSFPPRRALRLRPSRSFVARINAVRKKGD
jgi:hypothetical protein